MYINATKLQKILKRRTLAFMIVEFVGKGGAGKSTLATSFVKYLENDPAVERVLAIDADHNMHLASALLGDRDVVPYSGALEELINLIGETSCQDYREALLTAERHIAFDVESEFFRKYSVSLGKISLMKCGGHTDDIRADRSCSHSLFTPLKLLLPNLELANGQWVVIDEKAGTDGVGTGVAAGVDLAVVVSEGTAASVATAQQIIQELDYLRVSHILALNKVRSKSQIDRVSKGFGRRPDLIFHELGQLAEVEYGVVGPSDHDYQEFTKLVGMSQGFNSSRAIRLQRARSRLVKTE